MSFPIEKQLESEWCWAAVSCTTDHFFDTASTLTQCTIATEVLNPLNCCGGDAEKCNQAMRLQDALQPIGRLGNTIEGSLPFLELKSEIDADRPVAVRIAWFGGGAHFVLICGYELMQSGTRILQIADPFYGDEVDNQYFGIWEIDYDLFPESYQDGGDWTTTFFVTRKPGEHP